MPKRRALFSELARNRKRPWQESARGRVKKLRLGTGQFVISSSHLSYFKIVLTNHERLVRETIKFRPNVPGGIDTVWISARKIGSPNSIEALSHSDFGHDLDVHRRRRWWLVDMRSTHIARRYGSQSTFLWASEPVRWFRGKR